MKIFKQLLIIIGFSLFGILISYLLSLGNVNFPGSIIGMVFLFIFMMIKIVKIKDVDEVGKFFIDNMGIFFVPAAITILNRLEILNQYWWKFIIILLVGFVVSFTATYYSVKLTLYLQNKCREKKKEGVSDA